MESPDSRPEQDLHDGSIAFPEFSNEEEFNSLFDMSTVLPVEEPPSHSKVRKKLYSRPRLSLSPEGLEFYEESILSFEFVDESEEERSSSRANENPFNSPKLRKDLRLNLFHGCSSVRDGLAPAVPSLQLEMMEREYQEPVRDRDKCWVLHSQRDALNNVESDNDYKKVPVRFKESVNPLFWSPAFQNMMRKSRLLRTSKLISDTRCVIDIYGIGIIGRVFSEGGSGSRLLILEVYSVWNSQRHLMSLQLPQLRALLASKPELLKAGRKYDLLREIVGHLYFVYHITRPASSPGEIPQLDEINLTVEHLEKPQLPETCLQTVTDILRMNNVKNNTNKETPTPSITQTLHIGDIFRGNGREVRAKEMAERKRRLEIDFIAKQRAWLAIPKRKRGLVSSTLIRSRGRLFVLLAHCFPEKPANILLSVNFANHCKPYLRQVMGAGVMGNVCREVLPYKMWNEEKKRSVVHRTLKFFTLDGDWKDSYLSLDLRGIRGPMEVVQHLTSCVSPHRHHHSSHRRLSWFRHHHHRKSHHHHHDHHLLPTESGDVVVDQLQSTNSVSFSESDCYPSQESTMSDLLNSHDHQQDSSHSVSCCYDFRKRPDILRRRRSFLEGEQANELEVISSGIHEFAMQYYYTDPPCSEKPSSSQNLDSQLPVPKEVSTTPIPNCDKLEFSSIFGFARETAGVPASFQLSAQSSLPIDEGALSSANIVTARDSDKSSDSGSEVSSVESDQSMEDCQADICWQAMNFAYRTVPLTSRQCARPRRSVGGLGLELCCRTKKIGQVYVIYSLSLISGLSKSASDAIFWEEWRQVKGKVTQAIAAARKAKEDAKAAEKAAKQYVRSQNRIRDSDSEGEDDSDDDEEEEEEENEADESLTLGMDEYDIKNKLYDRFIPDLEIQIDIYVPHGHKENGILLPGGTTQRIEFTKEDLFRMIDDKDMLAKGLCVATREFHLSAKNDFIREVQDAWICISDQIMSQCTWVAFFDNEPVDIMLNGFSVDVDPRPGTDDPSVLEQRLIRAEKTLRLLARTVTEENDMFAAFHATRIWSPPEEDFGMLKPPVSEEEEMAELAKHFNNDELGSLTSFEFSEFLEAETENESLGGISDITGLSGLALNVGKEKPPKQQTGNVETKSQAADTTVSVSPSKAQKKVTIQENFPSVATQISSALALEESKNEGNSSANLSIDGLIDTPIGKTPYVPELLLTWSSTLTQKLMKVSSSCPRREHVVLRVFLWQRGTQLGVVAFDSNRSDVYFANPSAQTQKTQMRNFRMLSGHDRETTMSLFLSTELEYFEKSKTIEFGKKPQKDVPLPGGLRFVDGAVQLKGFSHVVSDDYGGQMKGALEKATEEAKERANKTQKRMGAVRASHDKAKAAEKTLEDADEDRKLGKKEKKRKKGKAGDSDEDSGGD